MLISPTKSINRYNRPFTNFRFDHENKMTGNNNYSKLIH